VSIAFAKLVIFQRPCKVPTEAVLILPLYWKEILHMICKCSVLLFNPG
jgi:hypothetical protein